MTRRNEILVCVMLSFMILFSSIGYAALSESLDISGTSEVEPGEYIGIYIFQIEEVSSSGAANVKTKRLMPTSLSTEVNASRGGSITYKITVHNNSDITYWYLGQSFDPDDFNNSLLGTSGGITVTTKDHASDGYASFNSEDWVPPQTYRDFYVTYTFDANATGTLSNIINFRFGMKMDAIHDKFLAVLNDNVSNYGYDYLSGAFDENYSENGSAVIGSTGEYKHIFDSLFGSNMTVNVNGEDIPVTVMVCRENVDNKTTGDAFEPSGPSGCEYTVYITVDPLNSSTGKAEVYAVSYSRGANGQWYQLGQLYTGEANRESGKAFDVYSWEATPNIYEVADGISYAAGYPIGQGDQYDQYKTIEQLMSAADQDIFNFVDNTNICKKVYDIIMSTPYDSPGVSVLWSAFSLAEPYFNNMNNGQEFKVKRDVTRAELVPVIIELQEAIDYYNQVK